MQVSRAKPNGFRLIFWVQPTQILDSLGGAVVRRCQAIISILSLLWASFTLAVSPRSWTEPVRGVMARQLLFTGVDGTWSAIRFGAAVGILLIVQAALWVDAIGITTDLIAPMLWRAIVRELAPLLACLVVIGRSGIAISTELATMRVDGELDVLDAQGIDPMTSLIMPRITSMVFSVFCLALISSTSMIMTGYVCGRAVGVIRVSFLSFLDQLIGQVHSLDLLFFLPKTIVAGAFAAAICCIDGLSVKATITDVPRVSSRAGIRALSAVFIISAILSILIYGRILIFEVF
ncbi:MAG: ABC transporter permease [Rubripirellula sp.]|nr:ABC transporter permease [Rubripirellula sp.]